MDRISYFADFGSKNRPYSGGYQFAEILLQILRSLPIELTVFSAVCKKVDRGENYATGQEIIKINLPIGGFGNPFVGLVWLKQVRKNLAQMPKQDLYIYDQPMMLIDKLPTTATVAMFQGDDFVQFKKLPWFHPRAFIYDLFWRKLFLNRVHKKLLTKQIGIPLFNSADTLLLLARDFEIDPDPLRQYITYLPVDINLYKRNSVARKEVRKKYNIADDEIVILALSNFDPAKGPERLMPIIQNILSAPPSIKIRFLLVGGGRASKVVDNIMKDHNIASFCVRVGEIPHNEVYKYYSAAEIGISTSLRESFGYFIAEGMASSLPFIAYRGGAIDEIIEHNSTGFLCDNKDEFTYQLRSLILDRNLCIKMGIAGRERINNLFSIDVFKKKLIKIINNEFKLSL